MRDHLLAIGIMTGNSLDGADLVLSRFGLDGSIEDLQAHSVPFPADLRAELQAVRQAVEQVQGRVDSLPAKVFEKTLDRYTTLLIRAVDDLRAKVGRNWVDLIGMHGQTCAHCPPSIAGTADPTALYTVQLGDGQTLADRTGVSVVCDFRSDDLMLGGEGAPLAPIHHRHLAELARQRGLFPIAFVNGGNTGNISVISVDASSPDVRVLGWDAGPFNHFPDALMRLQAGQACDLDGAVGCRGTIHLGLLAVLFDSAVSNGSGGNFLVEPAPKSSDPQWYRLVPELLGEAPIDGQVISFEDRIRTATYFASYVLAHSLALIPVGIKPPSHFAVAGGGWRNPLTLPDFRALLSGGRPAPILPDHAAHFARIRDRFGRAIIEPSPFFGIDGTAMEARIFADAAVCRVKGEPFTLPTTSGVRQPTICGIIRWPQGDRSRATEPLRQWLDHFGTDTNPLDQPERFDPRWSRACAGWSERCQPVLKKDR